MEYRVCFVYRFQTPITIVVKQSRLLQLPTGTMFYANDSAPDANGMVHGTCNGETVMMFSRDLEDRAEFVVEESVLRAGA